MGDVRAWTNEQGSTIQEFPISAERLAGLIELIDTNTGRAGDGQRQGGGQARERGKALVPAAPDGPGFERLACALVVEGDFFVICKVFKCNRNSKLREAMANSSETPV